MSEIETANSLSVAELHGLLQDGQNLLLLDTLPKSRYQQKHLPGAESTCVFEVNFLTQVAAISPDKHRPIVVYGVSEKTHDARTAAAKLLRDGYSHVSVLTGGLAAWQAAGYPLEGDAVDTLEQPAATPPSGNYQIDTEPASSSGPGATPTVPTGERYVFPRAKCGLSPGRSTEPLPSI